MSDFFIVPSRKFYRHPSLTEAEQARNRYAQEAPQKQFRVLRCKSHLHGARHFSALVKLLHDIRNEGLHEGTYERLNELLAKVGERGEQARAALAAANIEADTE